MQRIFFIVFFIIVMAGCSEVFQPDIENADSFLSIQGSITTQLGKQTVLLTYSRSYNEQPYFTGVTGAEVNVIDENSNRIHYNEAGNGKYIANITADNAAKVGSTYYLEVETEDGAVFRSTPQLIVPSPEILKFSCGFDRRTILNENTYGDIIEQEYPVMVLIIETEGILPSDNYYMYDYKAYEQCHDFYQDDNGMYHEFYYHQLLSGKYSDNIHTVNADEFGDFHVRNDELMYIILDDLRNYDTLYPVTGVSLSTRFEGLLIKLNQYSLSSDAYTFYHDVEEQLAAEGTLFDPAYTQLAGNIKCVSEPEQKVIGVFTASDVSDYYAYMYISTSNRYFSTQIDSFPELWLDTYSTYKPNDWINPPF